MKADADGFVKIKEEDLRRMREEREQDIAEIKRLKAISRKLVEFHELFKENTKDDIPGNPYYCGKIRNANGNS